MTSEAPPRKLNVLLVDDSRTILAVLKEIVGSAEDMTVVATAATGQDGMRRATELSPDVVLLDVNLPDTDGFEVASSLSARIPTTTIIMLTSEARAEMIQRAMFAGAHGYVTKPFAAEAVLQTVRDVSTRHREQVSRLAATVIRSDADAGSPAAASQPSYRRGQRVVVFGAKGGVGTTVIAANVAVALRVRTGKKVAAIDTDFSFGNLDLYLNVSSKLTISDLVPRMDNVDSDLLDQMMVEHPSGVRVLVAPKRPEEDELIKAEHVNRLLTTVPTSYDYCVVDCPRHYDDRVLGTLDRADLTLLVLTPEIGPIRNAKQFLRLADTFGLGREKLLLVLNRADSNVGISALDVERALAVKEIAEVPSGGRTIVTCVNEGRLMVTDFPKSSWARAVEDLVQQIQSRLHAVV